MVEKTIKIFSLKASLVLITTLFLGLQAYGQSPRQRMNFDSHWRFFRGDDSLAQNPGFDDHSWRLLKLPHDWSIEGDFNKNNPSTTQEGALPTGIGWYRKTFDLPVSDKNKNIYVAFDGIYRDSKVWINGHFLGERPNGYISFRYQLNPYLHFDGQQNVLSVRVNNAQQPNSRWYTGSGIYRNVWLLITNKIAVAHWGTYLQLKDTASNIARVYWQTDIQNTSGKATKVRVESIIYDAQGKVVALQKSHQLLLKDSLTSLRQMIKIPHPSYWFVQRPYLYKAVMKIISHHQLIDQYETPLGLRTLHFDQQKGFLLNGHPLRIHGVCLHNDLGALGTAVNVAAIRRRLELLKAMGCNAIRTAHNPPSPELLDLCDQMGFLVMDEAFDVWKKRKVKYDYHLYWPQWHKRDLQDQIRRDRNHPSVFMWSIGNEIREQFDSSGIAITRELVKIVKQLDTTRPITSALTETDPQKNYIYLSDALDVFGLNYNHQLYQKLPELFPGQKFIATETMSALETRGHYDMPSDSIRRWPKKGEKHFTEGNADFTASAYDNESAYWGSTHEETLKAIRKCPFIAGLFMWTGIDYLGEPTPYPWPARSSYFGIIDLAGFPKDAYYLYQSLWTDKPVLHIFPHWNWHTGDTVDVWAYYNHADEVELFLNGQSLGVRRKQGDGMHVMWRVPYQPGTLKAISRKDGKVVLVKKIETAAKAAGIILSVDRDTINADGKDLAYVSAKIVDSSGHMVPDANNLIDFNISGDGSLVATNNGYQANLEAFRSNKHKAYNGRCIAIVQSKNKEGNIILSGTSKGLKAASVSIKVSGAGKQDNF